MTGMSNQKESTCVHWGVHQVSIGILPNNNFFVFCICNSYTSTQALTVILKGLQEDSISFNGDPSHLIFNHGFPVQLSPLKKIAQANALSALLLDWQIQKLNSRSPVQKDIVDTTTPPPIIIGPSYIGCLFTMIMMMIKKIL